MTIKYGKEPFEWLEQNGWAGYDPYDIRGTELFLKLNRYQSTATVYKAISLLFPITLRRFLKVEKRINPKAVALIAHAYLDLYGHSENEAHRIEATKALNWLIENSTMGYSGYCWGYPFDWDSRTYIPASTPSVVVTAVAAESFLRAFDVLVKPRFLDVALGCAEFIANDLNQDWVSDDEMCFSYTPIDHWHVHNANLLAGATLARVSQVTGSKMWDHLIRSSTEYTLNAQREDGAWYYWGLPDKLLNMVDHYHTGFILRCLDSIFKYSASEKVNSAIEKGYKFYRKNLFTQEGIPKRTENKLYPIDIHSCAEAILCNVTLGYRFPGAMSLAQQVAIWTQVHMLADDGHFYYRKYPFLTISIPFVRWSQAWMVRALAGLLLAMNEQVAVL